MRLDLIAERRIEVVGDITWRGVCPLEDAELSTYFNQLLLWNPAVRSVALHIKNEDKRTFGKLQIDRSKGAINKGACDICVPGFPTLFIELKRRDHTQSKIHSDQLDYMENAQRLDCWVCVALGWEAALLFTKQWFAANYQNI